MGKKLRADFDTARGTQTNEKRALLLVGERRVSLQRRSDARNMRSICGELAQLGEHLPCTQGVAGSNPVFSTIDRNRLAGGPV